MASKEALRWARAEARGVELSEEFSDLSLIPRQYRGAGKIPYDFLTPEEGMVLARLDAQTSIEGVLGLTGFDRETTLRTLYVLQRSGILELVDEKRVQDERKEVDVLEREIGALEEKFPLLVDDPFAFFGVPSGAPLAQIRKAYREILARFHPDRMRQHRRFNKRLDAILEAMVEAFDRIAGSADQRTGRTDRRSGTDRRVYVQPIDSLDRRSGKDRRRGDADRRAQVEEEPDYSLGPPFPEPKNDHEKAENFCAEAVRLLQQGRGESAVPVLQKAVGLEPQNVRFRLRLANAMLPIKNLSHKADEQYKKILSMQPDNIDALLGLARLCIRIGKRPAALECIEKAKKAQPDHPALERLEDRLSVVKKKR
ncbi:MAG: tetratricopeptide repeat protein [Acidobacteriota bacterium]|nr:MAG: tetratricopeptide repeat protein [Acidobacteriota bacterium]